MRVTWLLEYPTLNGGERSLLATAESLRRAGFSLSAIAPSEGPLAQALRAADVEVCPFHFRGKDGARRPLETLRAELAELLARRRPSLMHANSLSMSRLLGPVTRSAGLPAVGHLRDIVKLSRRAMSDLNCLDRLLAVSAAAREFHLNQGLAPEKSHVLYNGVDLTSFQPRPSSGWLHRRLGAPPEARLIGAIGQLVMRKGWDTLALAAQALAERYSDVGFVVGGERFSNKAEAVEYERRLRSAFAAGPLAGRAWFLGTRDDVHLLLNELTLLAHPARQEPLGRVLLEAAAAGLPVVATDVGGAREIFPPSSGAARLVPADDPEALAEAIAALLDDGQLRANLGQAARRRAVKNFDARQAAAGLAQHYRAVLS